MQETELPLQEVTHQQTPAIYRPEATESRRQSAIERLQQKGSAIAAFNGDPRNDTDALALMHIDCSEQVSIWESQTDDIDCEYLHVRESEQFNRETGELQGRLRTTFVAANGQVFATSSPIVARSALTLLSSKYGSRPFDPPIAVRFTRKPTLAGGKALCVSFDLRNLANGNRD